MILKFSGGLWDGTEFEAEMAPQYVDLHGMMFGSKETAEIAETSAMEKQTTNYQIVDVIESPDSPDIIQYKPAK